MRLMIYGLFFCLLGCQPAGPGAPVLENGSWLVQSADGTSLRVTTYGKRIVRVQRVRANEHFLPDNQYEMVESHAWPREFILQDSKAFWVLQHPDNPEFQVRIDKQTLAVSFVQQGHPVLQELSTQWDTQQIRLHFLLDSKEHFSGLGHGFYGRDSSLDLRGKRIKRNYGREPIQQAPLIVPFYLSSKGYGVFLNSTFDNEFSFGDGNEYSLGLANPGERARLDYFFIAGPELRQVLDNYTQLTGRPRLPARAVFGLQLSDKGHDHTTATPSDENWWREKIRQHRAAGFPLDHVINDNRWRAGGGKRCESRMAWDRERYPDPRAYADWLVSEGLIMTLDINRCIAQYSEGWQAGFNVPPIGNIEFNTSAPDLTNPEFRHWFWQIFYQQSLDPALGFPGDALWIDEFDEMGAADGATRLANGSTWAEMRNYWFFLIAKALVQEGWDQSSLQDKRPFVWVRGMTAGAQRYATLWTGDIYPNYGDMQDQVRAMQLAGLSGFPFWGHDAGGFYDWNAAHGPDEDLYQQWAMAFGSFSPIWKPHGMGQSRWPLDRSAGAQATAHYFAQLRYELMPYLYTAAHQAAATGLPIARPLLLDYPQHEKAWQFDLQYLWGDSLLVAPVVDNTGTKNLWLPPGNWYAWQSDQAIVGEAELELGVTPGKLPLYVKQGAIIPRYQRALSTAFQDKTVLLLDVYVGANANAQIIEDDDTSMAYLRGEQQVTSFAFNHAARELRIYESLGDYKGAIKKRNYRIRFYGENTRCWLVNNQQLSLADGHSVLELTNIPATTMVVIKPCSLP